MQNMRLAEDRDMSPALLYFKRASFADSAAKVKSAHMGPCASDS